jgi:hypothetical protein
MVCEMNCVTQLVVSTPREAGLKMKLMSLGFSS